MVTKTRGSLLPTAHPVSWRYTFYNPDRTVSLGPVEVFHLDSHPPKRYEVIHYGVSGSERRMNMCSHQKFFFTHYGNRVYTSYAPGGSFAKYEGIPYFPGYTPEYPHSDAPADLMGKALKGCKPKLASEFSLPNFIWELKDIPKLLTPFGRKNADLSQRGSNLALAYNYGYAPLASDLKRIWALYATFLKDYKKFMRGLGKVQTSHAVSKTESPYSSDYNIAISGNPWSYGTRILDSEFTHIITVKYRYELLFGPPPGLPELFRRYIGLRHNPKIIWDMIPFSFVVDWVLKVGSWLSNFDTGAIPCRIVLLDACSSFKAKRVVEYWHLSTPSGGYYSSPGSNYKFAAAELHNYQRSPIHLRELAMHMYDLEFSNLSIRETALGASLINSNRR